MCYNLNVKRVRKQTQKKLETRTYALNRRKRSIMTTREFLTAVIASNISEEMNTKAQALIASLDKKNSQRKDKPSKTAIANEPIKQAIVNTYKGKGAVVASQVSADMGMNVQKASALLRQIVAEGTATVSEVKIPKKGKVKAYTIQ